MRINVYAEELTKESQYITKQVDGRTFIGIRLWLESATELHHTPNDDDRSAITLWIPWTKEKGNDYQFMYSVISTLKDALNKAAIFQYTLDEKYTNEYGIVIKNEKE